MCAVSALPGFAALAFLCVFMDAMAVDSAATALRAEAGKGPLPVRREVLDDPPFPFCSETARRTSPAGDVILGPYVSVQVNVDMFGNNVVDDAANEPSIAIDPLNPDRMAIGWREFDNVESNFRQAGNAYSVNGGQTWTFPGVLDPGQFRSDPILAADAEGNFYYYSLSTLTSAELFKSIDGGMTWGNPVLGYGGDKAWMAIDRTTGIGRGHIYAIWNKQFSCCPPNDFTRSINSGVSFQSPIAVTQPSMKWGTMDVGPDGTLYLAGATLNQSSHLFTQSANAQNQSQTPSFDVPQVVDLGGTTTFSGQSSPNPAGLLGQIWIATDHSDGSSGGNVYILGSVNPPGSDPLDVMFIRSTDGGQTWSAPVRVNDDPTNNGAFQWFGTMSVAPNGRIDVIWNDTRNNMDAPSQRLSELYYAWSLDAGVTWSPNIPLTPVFDSHIGWPQQNKLGDYYDMISDNTGAKLAYAATFNGEQDVYFLWIPNDDCNDNGTPDADDIAGGKSLDCNLNEIPDECEADCNDSGQPDDCDLAGGADDCDENGVPDECDRDFDGDGLIDTCDPDIDNDGVLNETDVCDFSRPGFPIQEDGSLVGDIGEDCVINLDDYFRFWICMRGPALFPSSDPCWFSFNSDGPENFHIDLRDFANFQNVFGR